ncbi:hypothetical protein Bca4012_096231 [Brassica carinata]
MLTQPQQPCYKKVGTLLQLKTSPLLSVSVPIALEQPPLLQKLLSWPKPTAARIQSGYRSHKIRGLYKTISSVHQEANRAQSTIQRQETVDAIRSDEKERLRMNETLMSLLLRLDSVPGSDPTIREARRKVSRRIVGMQEVLDSISEAKDENQWYDDEGGLCTGKKRWRKRLCSIVKKNLEK